MQLGARRMLCQRTKATLSGNEEKMTDRLQCPPRRSSGLELSVNKGDGFVIDGEDFKKQKQAISSRGLQEGLGAGSNARRWRAFAPAARGGVYTWAGIGLDARAGTGSREAIPASAKAAR